MENKLIWENKFEEKKKIVGVLYEDEALTLTFEGGQEITFSTYHDRDCCEAVSGDFSVFQYFKERLINKNFQKIEVKSIREMGFLLCFINEDDVFFEKVFIACYNYQNGFYSDDLALKIKYDNVTTDIDISDLVEDHISWG